MHWRAALTFIFPSIAWMRAWVSRAPPFKLCHAAAAAATVAATTRAFDSQPRHLGGTGFSPAPYPHAASLHKHLGRLSTCLNERRLHVCQDALLDIVLANAAYRMCSLIQICDLQLTIQGFHIEFMTSKFLHPIDDVHIRAHTRFSR